MESFSADISIMEHAHISSPVRYPDQEKSQFLPIGVCCPEKSPDRDDFPAQ